MEMTETEALLDLAREIAMRQVGSDAPDLVLTVFRRLCDEQDRQRYDGWGEDASETVH